MSNFNSYSGNQSNKSNSPTVYSTYRFNNANGEIEKTCMTFSFWNHTLKISISPKKETNNDEISFDYDNGISIYLNHVKARMFANEIKLFLEDPTRYNSSGVNSGSGLITISNGEEIGANCPCITIRKTDELGNIISSFAYEFKKNYYFSVRNYTENSSGGNFEKNFDDYNNIEILELITLLEEYYKSATAAQAYEFMEQNKYDSTRFTNKLDAIANKLGVEFGDRRNLYSGKSNNYFNNAQSSQTDTQFQTATLDDLD